MKHIIYKEQFSGHELRYAFQYPKAARYMFPYIRRTEDTEYNILASVDYIEKHKPYYTENMDEAYIEYKSLINLTSLKLLPYDCCIFHGVAVLIDGLCWLITAPSGTGKSTQYFNLKRILGNDVEMICGDMPLLEVREGAVIAHPSPWNGKERIKGHKSAGLGGILYLRQGNENDIRMLSSKEAMIPLLMQAGVICETKEQILHLSRMMDQILRHYPVWEMVNLGDLNSTMLALNTFREYRRKHANEI